MSITPLAAALAARPVPPRTPTKDYADVWLPVTLGTLAVVLVLLGLLALGWRARRRAQAGIPAPAPVPTALYDAEPTLSAEGMHVGTVRGEDRLDRVAVHGLGLRSRAVLEVHDAGAHRGLLVLRPGAANLFIPADDLVEAGLSAGIAGKFVEKLTARVKALKVGHPLDPATEIGPLIHERHLAKVCSYFDVAKKDGATIAVGGKPHDGPGGGHYVQPTLVTGANANMRVAQEEVFGPFLTVIPFKDEREAIEIANGVQYGLTGYVWTGEMGRALRVADALEAGMIWLNSENVRHLPTPFGGMKSSGIGRDGGDYSFDFYMETKHVSLARGTHKIQKLGI